MKEDRREEPPHLKPRSFAQSVPWSKAKVNERAKAKEGRKEEKLQAEGEGHTRVRACLHGEKKRKCAQPPHTVYQKQSFSRLIWHSNNTNLAADDDVGRPFGAHFVERAGGGSDELVLRQRSDAVHSELDREEDDVNDAAQNRRTTLVWLGLLW